MSEPSNSRAQPGSKMESPEVTSSPETDDLPLYGYEDDVDDYLLESLNDYCPGGFHPVVPGDLLGNDGRYRVVHKLGQGGFAIVWLCHDSLTNRWRAVKVMAAEASTPDCADLRAIELFKGIGLDVLEANHIQLPIDFFWVDGPNGRHLCSVLPLLGAGLSSLWHTYAPLTDMLKDVCYQMVKAMQFMHSRGLCHGDFRPDNMLLRLADGVDKMPEEELIRVLGEPELVPVLQMTSLPDSPDEAEWTPVSELNQSGLPVPKYLVQPRSIFPTTGLCSTQIAVIDFGVSYQAATTQTKRTGIPFQYAAPEDGFGQTQCLGLASDVWSLGCSIVEVYCGDPPFGDEHHSRFETVASIEHCLGPLPQPYRTVWKSWNGNFVNTPCQKVTCYRTHDNGGKEKYVRKEYDESWQDETVYASCSAIDVEAMQDTREELTGTRDFLEWTILYSHHTSLMPSQVEPLKATWKANRKRLPAHTPIENEEATKRGWKQAEDYYYSTRDKEDAAQLFEILRNIFKWHPKDRTTVGWIAKHEWFGKRNRRLSKAQRRKSSVVSRGRPAGKRRSTALRKRNTSAIPEAGEPYRPGQNGSGGK